MPTRKLSYILLLIPSLLLAAGINVTTKSIDSITIHTTKYLPAEVISLNNSIISSEITGRITDLNVSVGDKVEKGNIIARVDCSDYMNLEKQTEAKIQALQAEISLAKWQVTQDEKLISKKHVSEQVLKRHTSEFESLNAKLAAEQQNLALSKTNISRCNIKATFNGTITEKFISLGEYVTPGKKIIQLTNTDNVEVEANLHPSEVKSIKNICSEQIIYFKYNGNRYPIQVRTILPKQNPKTNTSIVRFHIPYHKPIPGIIGKITWQSKHPVIPAKYIQNINNAFGIYVVKDNKAKFWTISNVREGRNAVITKDIPYPIIINGRYKVRDGQPIDIK